MATTEVLVSVAKKAAQKCINAILEERKELHEKMVSDYKLKLENRWFKKYRKQLSEEEIVKAAERDSFDIDMFPDWSLIYCSQESRAEKIIELCEASSTGYITVDFKEAELINDWKEK